MFKGNVLFLGERQLRSKEGKSFSIARFCDNSSGEVCELFVPAGVVIPPGLKLFSPVEVTIIPQGKNFRLESVTQSIDMKAVR
jgi:hypothetical protein